MNLKPSICLLIALCLLLSACSQTPVKTDQASETLPPAPAVTKPEPKEIIYRPFPTEKEVIHMAYADRDQLRSVVDVEQARIVDTLRVPIPEEAGRRRLLPCRW